MKILETDRLILRTLEMSDLDEMTKINQDPKVMQHFPSLENKEETRAWIEKIKKFIKPMGIAGMQLI